MPELTGQDAEDFINRLRRRNAEQRSLSLQAARQDAEARGKEPFDLARLETLCDTSSEGRIDPEEERRSRFEEMYYVWFPSVMTLADFAQKVEELNTGGSTRRALVDPLVTGPRRMVSLPRTRLQIGLTSQEADRLALELARMEGELFEPGLKAFAVFDLDASRARRREWLEASMPAHAVEIGPFEMDVYPVTNAQWAQYMAETGAPRPGAFSAGDERHFVTGISWQEAATYARHYGLDLPTEVEWECAARAGRNFFTWGNHYFPQGEVAFRPPVGEPYAVGSRPETASPHGVHDMLGQFGEYCADAFAPYAGADPAFWARRFPDGKKQRVVRGGYDIHQDATCVSRRGVPPDERRAHLKFRCVRRTS